MNTLHDELLSTRRDARLLYTLAEVDSAIEELATRVVSDYAGKDPVLLCVMNGGLFICGRLLPLLDFPLQVDYVHASRYEGKLQGGDTLAWRVLPQMSLADRDVLIVDDILDEGSTLLGIIEACKQQGASSVKTVIMLEKLHNRKASADLEADYCALNVEDVYVFGCGMDYKNYWRNAPGIFAV